SAVGRMNACYPDGAVTVAKAAKETRTLQVLAGSAAVIVDPRGVERVVEARGEPLWIAGLGRSMDEKVLRRFEATGCPVLVWTIDDGGANTIGAKSVQRAGVRDLDREAADRCVGGAPNLPQITRITKDTPMDGLGAIGALQGETSGKLNGDDGKR